MPLPAPILALLLALGPLGHPPAALAADGHAHAAGGEDGDHLAELGALRALRAWANATRDDTALVYVELENGGGVPILLSGAAADLAVSATLVGFRMEDGEGTHVEIGAPVPIAPGRALALAPGGLAIRLAGLSRALEEGGSFPLHLETSAGELTVTVAIEAEDARQHGHAGHAH